MKNLKKIDLLIYFSSFISLILIVLLLSSSSSISYQINDVNIKKSTELDTNKKSISFASTSAIDRDIFLSKKKSEASKTSFHNNGVNQGIIKSKLDIKLTEKYKIKKNSIKKSITESPIKEKRVIYHTVRRGECLWTISRRYNTSMRSIIEINRIKNPNLLKVGKKLKIYITSPYTSKSKRVLLRKNRVTIRHSNNYLQKRNVKFIWPLRGRLTSGFGVRRSPYDNKMEFHTGIDIAAPIGKKFKASEDGKVIFVGIKGGYGLAIIIQHSNGYKTLYGHCLISFVRKGQYVRRGQVIGKVGESGITTGPHLHFEIRKNNFAIDPTTLINKRKLFY